MKLQETKLYVDELKLKIDKVLSKSGNERISEIIKIMNYPEIEKIMKKDNQLLAMHIIYNIWIAERRYGYEHTFLDNVSSLKEAEELYANITYFCRRFENKMPEEYLVEGIDYIKKHQVSGVALEYAIEAGIWKKEEMFLKIARYLKADGQLLTATILLDMAVKDYPKNQELVIELADCWLEGQQWQQAYRILKMLKAPSAEIQEIINSLEGVIDDENI